MAEAMDCIPSASSHIENNLSENKESVCHAVLRGQETALTASRAGEDDANSLSHFGSCQEKMEITDVQGKVVNAHNDKLIEEKRQEDSVADDISNQICKVVNEPSLVSAETENGNVDMKENVNVDIIKKNEKVDVDIIKKNENVNVDIIIENENGNVGIIKEKKNVNVEIKENENGNVDIKGNENFSFEILKESVNVNVDIIKRNENGNVDIMKKNKNDNVDIIKENENGSVDIIKENDNDNVEIIKENENYNVDIVKENNDNVDLNESENGNVDIIMKNENGNFDIINDNGNVDVIKENENGNVDVIKENENGNVDIIKENENGNIDIIMENENKNVDIIKENENKNVDIIKEIANGNIKIIKENENGNVDIIKENENGNADIIKENENDIIEIIKENENDNVEIKENKNSNGDIIKKNMQVNNLELMSKNITKSESVDSDNKAKHISYIVDSTANVQNIVTNLSDIKSTQDDNNLLQPESSGDHNYELIDGQYYYTDNETKIRYCYDSDLAEWTALPDENERSNVSIDSEGRTYYYADDMYLCRDPEGSVFYMDEKQEWIPWSEKIKDLEKDQSSKWYFYQGKDMFCRDNETQSTFKMNKEKNEWEIYKEKVRKKRTHNEDEEFDTDDDYESEEDTGDGTAPPGFRNDPNISYDGHMYTKLDPSDNMMYEWDINRKAWFPKLDEDFMATYQLSYGFNPDGTKNENPVKYDDDNDEDEEEERKKEEELKKKKEKGKQKPTWFQMEDAHNTKVYVSKLPESMTEKEYIDLMQKCGLVFKDGEGKYKIKMYRDDEGNFKGDALCTYIKVESVELALQILDSSLVGNNKISVERAKFTQKGEYDPMLKPKKRRKKELDKLAKKQEKLFDWRPEPMRGQRLKHENTVVIKNVFDPKEFERKMEKILVHKETIRAQCLSFGLIKRLDLFDLHPDGVVQVAFVDIEAADMCIATMNNRLYQGRILKVETWDGKEKFKIEDTLEEKDERLKRWEKFLEDEEDKKNKEEYVTKEIDEIPPVSCAASSSIECFNEKEDDAVDLKNTEAAAKHCLSEKEEKDYQEMLKEEEEINKNNDMDVTSENVLNVDVSNVSESSVNEDCNM